MKKRGFLLLLAITLVLSSFATTNAAVNITDIDGHRSEAIIREAVELGVIKGYPDGTYRPNGVIKREEFFSIINNVLTVRPDTTRTQLDFIDIDQVEWYIPVVKTMVEGKITQGIGWGKVGIGLNITRQEAIKILGTIIPTNELSKEDVDIYANDKDQIADWAKPYYQIMFKKGYLNNTTQNIGPTVSLTREEAAILLLKIKKGEDIIAGNANEIAGSLKDDGGCVETDGHKSSSGAFTKGDGTKDSPYIISTGLQLNHVREHMGDETYFALSNNINITSDFQTDSIDFSSEEMDWSLGNFKPIGNEDIPFNGTFDGAGYKIEGLNIIGTQKAEGDENARILTSKVGFFGYVGEKGVVENLLIDSSRISGRDYTGAIAGYSKGLIRNCGIGSQAIIRGVSFTGGIAGFNGYIVENTFSLGDITGTTATGILIGRNYGVLRDSYWLLNQTIGMVGSSGMEASVNNVNSITIEEFEEKDLISIINE